jgi:phage terminase small subunit
MPTLTNPRHEAFAQARARGLLLDHAYEVAGFSPGHRHASRLARQPEIAERIGELLASRLDAREVDTRTVIDALLRLAENGHAAANPAAIHETRLVLLEACKLIGEQEKVRELDRNRVSSGM